MYLINGEKPTIKNLFKKQPELLENFNNFKIDPATGKELDFESKANGLDFFKKTMLAAIGKELDFKYNPIISFLKRCERIYKANPSLSLDEIVARANIGKKTGSKPNYPR